MKRFIVGIRAKDSKVIRGMQVVEDLQSFVRDVKAGVKANPACAYALFPNDYEIVYTELTESNVNWDSVAFGE